MGNSEYQDGLYFGLDEKIYHAIPRLSASGIKDLAVDAFDFWHCSWMNPLKEESEGNHFELGKIIHKRILEGSEEFSKLYAPAFNAPEDCVKGSEEIKEAIKNLGAKPKGRKKAEYIAQLQELDPSILIYDVMKEEYESQFQGVSFVSQGIINSVEYTAAMIEKDPIVRNCFTGGMPEVTVLYTIDGVKLKSRLDYLKPSAGGVGQVNDLKTFSNPYNKAIDIAIKGTMAANKYHIPAVLYTKAAYWAAKFAKENRFYGSQPHNDEQIYEFCQNLGETKDFDFNFIFRKTTKAPVVSVYKFGKHLTTWAIGEHIVQSSLDKFKFYSDTFGDAAWILSSDIQEFCDEDFPSYMTDL